MGYDQAGFEVVGVDILPQPRYPFTFHQANALELLLDAAFLDGFGAIHASPPCPAYSMMTRNLTKTAGEHPRLIGIVRELLRMSGLPWVIENVPGAPLRADYKLCGCMFGLHGIRRERWFETSWQGFAMVPGHDHTVPAITIAGHGMPAWSRKAHGRNLTLPEKQAAMGIGWMTRDQLSDAIPPAYTRFIGEHLMARLPQEVPA